MPNAESDYNHTTSIFLLFLLYAFMQAHLYSWINNAHLCKIVFFNFMVNTKIVVNILICGKYVVKDIKSAIKNIDYGVSLGLKNYRQRVKLTSKEKTLLDTKFINCKHPLQCEWWKAPTNKQRLKCTAVTSAVIVQEPHWAGSIRALLYTLKCVGNQLKLTHQQ